MNEFIYLSSLDNRNLSLQIIKVFSILILSISNSQTLYYLFSNNFINQIMCNDFEKYDEEFVSHYVNFLKSLMSRLDSITIQFFFHKSFNSFSICSSCLKLYNYPDPMIKNTVRNIILGLFKLDYSPLIDFFSSLPTITYFAYISLSFRDLIIKLNDDMINNIQNINNKNTNIYSNLETILDDIVTDILYFEDLFSIKIKRITNILINVLFYYTILPLLTYSITCNEKPRIAITISLHIICLLFKYIKNEIFLNLLYSVIFFPKFNRKMNNLIKNYPKNIYNYYFNWNDQIKRNKIPNYVEYIRSNFSEPFIYYLISYNVNANGEEIYSDYKEVNDLKSKLRKMFKDNIDLSDPNYYQPVLHEILRPFYKNNLDNMMEYHKNLSIATGVNVGLYMADHKKNSFVNIMHKNIYKIKIELYLNNLDNNKDRNIFDYKSETFATNKDNYTNNNISIEKSKEQLHFINNEIRENVISYLTSKDDGLVQLVNLLINMTHTKNISLELQGYCGFLQARKQDELNNKKDNYELDSLTKLSLYENKNYIKSAHNDINEINNNNNNEDNNYLLDINDIFNYNRKNMDKLLNDNNKDISNSNEQDINVSKDNINYKSNKSNSDKTNVPDVPNSNFNQKISKDTIKIQNNKSNSNKECSQICLKETNNRNSIIVNGRSTQLDFSNIMSFYNNLKIDELEYDNVFIQKELNEIKQKSYNYKLIDICLEVILLNIIINYIAIIN